MRQGQGKSKDGVRFKVHNHHGRWQELNATRLQVRHLHAPQPGAGAPLSPSASLAASLSRVSNEQNCKNPVKSST